MALSAGTRLGPYEILEPLGAGGMGEVYRARDPRLGRDVAVKVLPEALADDAQRLARLKREARTLASVNHPGIATLLEIGDAEGTSFLVMELVEGPTLAERIRSGALPLVEVLELGCQIAAALEAAHEKAIIHRDLKPSNVKLTKEGRVKLLDFGLAKVSAGGAVDSEGPTATREGTATGTVLGTAAYMSPEQARGQELDRRTDVWSFGCVLYEMLTGRRAFQANTVSDTLAGVLEHEPDWDALPEGTPAPLQALLRRCLRKKSDERLRDIGDARIELKETLDELSSAPGPAKAVRLPAGRKTKTAAWFAGLCVVSLATAWAGWFARRAPRVPTTPPTRLTFAPPPGAVLVTTGSAYQHLALSPRGDRVAFHALTGPDRSLFVREMNEIEAKRVPGTEGAMSPFLSPDGRWIGFSQGGQLKKVSLDGGAPVVICDLPPGGSGSGGASWGPDGTVVFVPRGHLGLWRVSSDGGTPRQIRAPDPAKGEGTIAWPQVLPDGRAAIVAVSAFSNRASDSRIAVVDLETGQKDVVLEGTGFARYSPTGHLLYGMLGTVVAIPFDVQRRVVTGPGVPVLDDVQMALLGHSYADFDTSASGALAYVPGFPRQIARSLLWVDRDGRVEPLSPARRPYTGPSLSPDGRRLLATVRRDDGTGEIWSLDLEREAWARIAEGMHPRWSPDGRSIAFLLVTHSGDQIMTMPADAGGPPRAVGPTLGNTHLNAWSRDAQTLVFSQDNKDRMWDLGVLPLAEPDKQRLMLAQDHTECCAALSPDGRWMAYVSNEAGDYDVYLRQFPGLGQKVRVSTDGGMQPRWSRDGGEIFYRRGGAHPKLMAVALTVGEGSDLGRPRALFDDTFSDAGRLYYPARYDVAPNGRFVFVEASLESPAPHQLVLIPDFASELEAKFREAGQ